MTAGEAVSANRAAPRRHSERSGPSSPGSPLKSRPNDSGAPLDVLSRHPRGPFPRGLPFRLPPVAPLGHSHAGSRVTNRRGQAATRAPWTLGAITTEAIEDSAAHASDLRSRAWTGGSSVTSTVSRRSPATLRIEATNASSPT